MPRVATNRPDKAWVRNFLHTAFVRYGAGSDLFLPLTRMKAWNLIAWTTIAIGALTWCIVLVVWNF